MDQYEIAFQPSVEKDLRKLSSENRDRILVRIAELKNEPLPSQVSSSQVPKVFIELEWATIALFMKLIQKSNGF